MLFGELLCVLEELLLVTAVLLSQVGSEIHKRKKEYSPLINFTFPNVTFYEPSIWVDLQ